MSKLNPNDATERYEELFEIARLWGDAVLVKSRLGGSLGIYSQIMRKVLWAVWLRDGYCTTGAAVSPYGLNVDPVTDEDLAELGFKPTVSGFHVGQLVPASDFPKLPIGTELKCAGHTTAKVVEGGIVCCGSQRSFAGYAVAREITKLPFEELKPEPKVAPYVGQEYPIDKLSELPVGTKLQSTYPSKLIEITAAGVLYWGEVNSFEYWSRGTLPTRKIVFLPEPEFKVGQLVAAKDFGKLPIGTKLKDSMSGHVYYEVMSDGLRYGGRTLGFSQWCFGRYIASLPAEKVAEPAKPKFEVGQVISGKQAYRDLPIGAKMEGNESTYVLERVAGGIKHPSGRVDAVEGYYFERTIISLPGVDPKPVEAPKPTFHIGQVIEGKVFADLPVGAVAVGLPGTYVSRIERVVGGIREGSGSNVLPASWFWSKRVIVALPGISEADVAAAKKARLAYWESLGEPRKSEPRQASLEAWIAAVKAVKES